PCRMFDLSTEVYGGILPNCCYNPFFISVWLNFKFLKKMGAETQKLATVSFVTDTDVSYYEIGEVEGSFQKEELKDSKRTNIQNFSVSPRIRKPNVMRRAVKLISNCQTIN